MTGAQVDDSRPAIVQYWHSTKVPPEIAELTSTFRDRNPDLRHLLFSEREAEAFIAERFTAREVAAFKSCAVPAMQADYFRYCAVLALGRIYADADFLCLRPLRELLDTAEGGTLFRRVPPGNLINGIFLFKAPGHPLLRLALDVATENIESRAGERIYGVTGPAIFIGLEALHRLGSPDTLRARAADAGFERLADAMLRAVGDHRRVAEAFRDVRIVPLDTAMDWIGPPESPLDYKRGASHWVNWHKRKLTIFR